MIFDNKNKITQSEYEFDPGGMLVYRCSFLGKDAWITGRKESSIRKQAEKHFKPTERNKDQLIMNKIGEIRTTVAYTIEEVN